MGSEAARERGKAQDKKTSSIYGTMQLYPNPVFLLPPVREAKIQGNRRWASVRNSKKQQGEENINTQQSRRRQVFCFTINMALPRSTSQKNKVN